MSISRFNSSETVNNLQVNKEKEKVFIKNKINEAQELESKGLNRLACGTLFQALTDKNMVKALNLKHQNLNCEDFNNQEIFEKVKAALEVQFSSLQNNDLSRLKVTALRGFGDAVRLFVDINESVNILNIALKASTKFLPQNEAEVSLSLGNAMRFLGNRVRERNDSIKNDYINNIGEAEIKLGDAFSSNDSICANNVKKSDFSQEPEAINFYKQSLTCYHQATTKAQSLVTKIQANINYLSLLIDIDKWLRKKGQDTFANSWWSKIEFNFHNLAQLKQEVDTLTVSQEAIYIQINFTQILSYIYFKHVKTISNKDFYNSNDLHLSINLIEELLNKAVSKSQLVGNKRIESYAVGSIGKLYEQNKEYAKGLKFTMEALVSAKKIKANDIVYKWAWQCARILKAQGDIGKAIDAYAEAFNNIQYLQKNFSTINTEIRFDFRDNIESIYRELINLLVQYKPNPGDSQLTLQNQNNKEILQIVKNYNSKSFTSNLFNENLKLSLGILESLQLAQIEDYFQCSLLSALTNPVNNAADKSSSAVFYPIIFDDRLEVILELPGSELQHFKANVSRNTLEAKIKEIGKDLKDVGREGYFRKSTNQLYNWLIKDAEKYLDAKNIKTLVFVLDGSLRKIPMSALYDGKDFIIRRYSIAITPGLTILEPIKSNTTPSTALIAGLTTSNNIKIKTKESVMTFDPLSYVESEVRNIKEVLPDTKQIIGNDFNIENFRKDINSGSYPIVHLATHANFSSSPRETFIVTASQQPIYINDLQDILQVRKQTRRDLIELLVFSACKTAAGDSRATLGLAGVAIQAGASSTLASLWSVNDESTALLMKNFYQEWIKNPNKITKAEALRKAQLALLDYNKDNKDNKDYDLPYYWAPFVLIGNWL